MYTKLLFVVLLISVAALPCGARVEGPQRPQSTGTLDLASRIRNVEIKNSSSALAIRDNLELQTKEWVSDLRVEVVNVSNRPIYYASVSITFPGIVWKETGNAYGFGMRYGDKRLGDLRNVAESADRPVMPGETFVLEASSEVARGLKIFMRERKIPVESARKVELVWQDVSFGDGTGLQSGSLVYPVADASRIGCILPCSRTGIDANWYCDYPNCRESYPKFDPRGNCMSVTYTDYLCPGEYGFGGRPCSHYTFSGC